MPADFYRFWTGEMRTIDNIGILGRLRDWAAGISEPSEEMIMRSQYELFWRVGLLLFKDPGQARDYAWRHLGVITLEAAEMEKPQSPRQQHLFQDRDGIMEAAR
jgi:hypothetical protein